MKTVATFPGAALRKVYNLQKRNKSNNYIYIQFHARFLINSSCSVFSETGRVVYYMECLAAVFNTKIDQRMLLCAQTDC